MTRLGVSLTVTQEYEYCKYFKLKWMHLFMTCISAIGSNYILFGLLTSALAALHKFPRSVCHVGFCNFEIFDLWWIDKSCVIWILPFRGPCISSCRWNFIPVFARSFKTSSTSILHINGDITPLYGQLRIVFMTVGLLVGPSNCLFSSMLPT